MKELKTISYNPENGAKMVASQPLNMSRTEC